MELSTPDDDCEWVLLKKSLTDEGADSGNENHDLLKVEFFEAASSWTDALPLGNGKLGAMVYGGVPVDVLMLNDDTLYTGGPKDWNNPSAKDVLPKLRQAVFDGHFCDASRLAQEMLGPYCQLYQPLGAIELQFDEQHQAFDRESYHRQLDLETAIVSVKYRVGDVNHTREYFISQPHQVLAVKISADKGKSITFSANLLSPLQEGSALTTSNRILMRGRAPGDVVDSYVTGQGMAFAAALEIRAGGESGTVKAEGDQALRVTCADWVVLLLASSTSFDGPFRSPVISGIDPAQSTLATLKGVEGLAFHELLKSHLNDYQGLFHRLTLRLARSREDFLAQKVPEYHVNLTRMTKSPKEDRGAHPIGRQVNQEDDQAVPVGEIPSTSGAKVPKAKEKLSTRDRLENFKENQDPRMVTLLFQFGRYLLLASSRPGTFVTNLQGIWNKDLDPAWRCVPHININLPMNYWPAETCNLSECHGPLFDTIETMAINGRTTAEVNYGLEGWVGHHNVDIWGQTAPVGGDPVWALWPMGGAWLSLHMWDHYCFSLDMAFLRDRAYPILKGCAQFLLGWLVEDSEGILLTNPSTSPEHYFISPDTGNIACVAYASAMDMEIIREVLKSVLEADQILGSRDEEFTGVLKAVLGRLSPVKLSRDGCLMEWGQEFRDPEEHHRHMSHLFGVFPGRAITPLATPELCEAATQSILKRGEVGPGWSMAWKIALWARLWNEDHAYRMVARMFSLIGPDETTERYDGGGLYCNLFNAHPPFQIDGNFGFTGAVAEMFLQSDGVSLYLLPALPVKQWPFGKVEGLQGRGAVTVSIIWESGELVEVKVEVEVKSPALSNLYYRKNRVDISQLSPAYIYKYNKDLNLQHVRPKATGPVGTGETRCKIL